MVNPEAFQEFLERFKSLEKQQERNSAPRKLEKMVAQSPILTRPHPARRPEFKRRWEQRKTNETTRQSLAGVSALEGELMSRTSREELEKIIGSTILNIIEQLRD